VARRPALRSPRPRAGRPAPEAGARTRLCTRRHLPPYHRLGERLRFCRGRRVGPAAARVLRRARRRDAVRLRALRAPWLYRDRCAARPGPAAAPNAPSWVRWPVWSRAPTTLRPTAAWRPPARRQRRPTTIAYSPPPSPPVVLAVPSVPSGPSSFSDADAAPLAPVVTCDAGGLSGESGADESDGSGVSACGEGCGLGARVGVASSAARSRASCARNRAISAAMLAARARSAAVWASVSSVALALAEAADAGRSNAGEWLSGAPAVWANAVPAPAAMVTAEIVLATTRCDRFTWILLGPRVLTTLLCRMAAAARHTTFGLIHDQTGAESARTSAPPRQTGPPRAAARGIHCVYIGANRADVSAHAQPTMGPGRGASQRRSRPTCLGIGVRGGRSSMRARTA